MPGEGGGAGEVFDIETGVTRGVDGNGIKAFISGGVRGWFRLVLPWGPINSSPLTRLAADQCHDMSIPVLLLVLVLRCGGWKALSIYCLRHEFATFLTGTNQARSRAKRSWALGRS
jgi:hypothetical protein